MERLERRELLSADVFTYGGAALTSRALKGEPALLGWTQDSFLSSSVSASKRVMGGDKNDPNGVLLDENGDPEYPVIFLNGGRSRASRMIGEAGRANVVSHVMQGGSIVGSCAGAFMLNDSWRYHLGLMPLRMPSNRSGTQTVSFAHLDDGHPVKEFLYDHGVTDYIVSGIPQLGGPRFNPANARADGIEFIGEIIGASKRIRSTVGTYYAVGYQPPGALGFVIGASGHLEYNRKPQHVIANAALLNYARLRSQIETPVYLGEGARGDSEGESWQVFVEPTSVVAETITLAPDQPLVATEERQELFASLATEQEEIVYRPLPVVAVDRVLDLGLLV